MKGQVQYIKDTLDKYPGTAVSIHTGKLSKEQIKEFGKHFEMKKEYFGYTLFSYLDK